MKKYIKESLMMAGMIVIVVTVISFLLFDYQEDMGLIFSIYFIAFLTIGIHYITKYLLGHNFILELLIKYLLTEIVVLSVGFVMGWFNKTNWWMTFVYVTPVFALFYLLESIRIKKIVHDINTFLKD